MNAAAFECKSKTTNAGGEGDVMAKHSPSIDDAVVEALATNSLHALADLVTNPEIAERIRGHRLEAPHQAVMIQARATVKLLRDELGETRNGVLIVCMSDLHYGGHCAATVADKIMRGSLPTRADTKAAGDLVRWICESPTRKAAHLARLQAVLTKYDDTPKILAPTKMGVSDDEDDG